MIRAHATPARRPSGDQPITIGLMFLALSNRCLHDGVMPTAGTSAAAQAPIGDSSQHRWEEMLGSLAELLPARSRCALIDGPADQAGLFAARLAEKLSARGRQVGVTLDA